MSSRPSIRYRTEEPDYTYLPDMKHDWTYTVYGNTQEIIPHDCPKPLGKSVTTTTTLDANLLHCMARVHHLLHVSIFAITPQLTGTPRNKQLWKLQHMDQSLWQPRQPQNGSWTLDTH